ncbi:MAG: adenine nucleotide alpha hydrolase [Bacteroides sp. SM23_62_1]|nr:MAG: adenine nucleotide alpha hydrolase [Bacteroides sp. SM23_62_1]
MVIKGDQKYTQLVNYLKQLGNAALAFSGGVDSTFLLKASVDALGDKVLAITVNSPYIPDWEIDEAKKIAVQFGVRHIILEAPLSDQIINNPTDRCYLCKTFVFSRLRGVAKEHGFTNIIDGTNSEDSEDERPGMKALRELDVKSPLKETGFTKKDIRRYSWINNLPTWDKPAYACLLTRIPYNNPVEKDNLRRIEKAEKFLIDLGIRSVRVRVHDDLARIETEPSLINKIFQENLMEKISGELKSYGFKYVTLDLEGYRPTN